MLFSVEGALNNERVYHQIVLNFATLMWAYDHYLILPKNKYRVYHTRVTGYINNTISRYCFL